MVVTGPWHAAPECFPVFQHPEMIQIHTAVGFVLCFGACGVGAGRQTTGAALPDSAVLAPSVLGAPVPEGHLLWCVHARWTEYDL